ncbi:MAG: glycerophosphodiester phosphodiesterase family protein [Pseudomonadota bacterium]
MNRPNVLDPGPIIAHRGARLVAPENTLLAFRMAEAQGTPWVEFDVSLLGDGTPVVHHDATLDRCTDATGSLQSIGKDDLADIDAAAGHPMGHSVADHPGHPSAHPSAHLLARHLARPLRHASGNDLGRPLERPVGRAWEPLPTLQEALALLDSRHMFGNLEIKTHGNAPDEIAQAVNAELSVHHWTRERILVSSFQHDTLAALRALNAEIPLATLYKAPSDDWPSTADDLSAAAVHVHYRYLSKSLLTHAQRIGVDVRVYTVNDPALLQPFLKHGLTSVITDDPALFLDDPEWRAWADESG